MQPKSTSTAKALTRHNCPLFLAVENVLLSLIVYCAEVLSNVFLLGAIFSMKCYLLAALSLTLFALCDSQFDLDFLSVPQAPYKLPKSVGYVAPSHGLRGNTVREETTQDEEEEASVEVTTISLCAAILASRGIRSSQLVPRKKTKADRTIPPSRSLQCVPPAKKHLTSHPR